MRALVSLVVLSAIACGPSTSKVEDSGVLAYRKGNRVWIAEGAELRGPLPEVEEEGGGGANIGNPVWLRDGSGVVFLQGFTLVKSSESFPAEVVRSFSCGGAGTRSVELEGAGPLLMVSADGVEQQGENGNELYCTWYVDALSGDVFAVGGQYSSTDGERVLVCEESGESVKARLADLRSDSSLWEVERESCPLLSEDGQWIASAVAGALKLEQIDASGVVSSTSVPVEGHPVLWGPEGMLLIRLFDGRWSVVDPEGLSVETTVNPVDSVDRAGTPVWSAKSDRVLVSERCDGDRHRYRILGLDLEAEVSEWRSSCDEWSTASISPDGASVALSRGRGEDAIIVVVRTEAGAEEMFLDEGTAPVWSP